MYFCYFIIISPWKRLWPFIWTNLHPLHPRMLCAKLVEIGSVVLEKKLKMWKIYDNNDYDGHWQIVIRKSHFSLWLRWAKKMSQGESCPTPFSVKSHLYNKHNHWLLLHIFLKQGCFCDFICFILCFAGVNKVVDHMIKYTTYHTPGVYVRMYI